MSQIITRPGKQDITFEGDVIFEGSMSYGDALVPAMIMADTDNYDPTGWQDHILIDISSNGIYDLTGWVRPDPLGTRVIYVFNVGTNNIIFKDNNANSLSYNRFLLGANKTIQADEGIILIYDTDQEKWKSPAINI